MASYTIQLHFGVKQLKIAKTVGVLNLFVKHTIGIVLSHVFAIGCERPVTYMHQRH